MSIAIRIFVGALGLASLVGTVLWVLNLLARDYDVEVLLAGYMAIGGILVGAFFLLYAVTGRWRPNEADRKKQ